MSWYRAGTVSLTNGSGTVTGSGTAFIANAQIGEGFIAPDGRVYEITNIASDTALTISPAYLGSTASGQGYAIAPLRGRIAQLLSETSSLLNSFATVRDGIGAGLFPAGTVSLPAGRFAGDQDTGFYRVGSNEFGISAGGGLRGVFNPNGLAVGAVVNDGRGALLVQGVDQATGALTDAGAHGASLYLRAVGASSGDGGALLFGTTFGSQTPFAAIKGSVVNGASQTQGNLIFALRVNATDNALTERWLISPDGTFRPAADNAVNFGTSGFRIGTIFAASGTINTSDEREKEWRGPLDETELRAAKRIIGELGIYQWLASVAEKGDDARLHFGVRAQRAFAILEDEGLDWKRYAWCCYDEWQGETWTDEKGKTRVIGESGNRYGVRTDQLAFWLIAAQAAMQADLDARLTALEGGAA